MGCGSQDRSWLRKGKREPHERSLTRCPRIALDLRALSAGDHLHCALGVTFDNDQSRLRKRLQSNLMRCAKYY
jgi:hypothetical protein